MEKSIFENAKFGDKFVTRNGEIVIFDKFTIRNSSYIIICYHQDLGVTEYSEDGKCIEFNSGDVDILSKYQEPFDNKELNLLAEKYCISEFAMTHEDSTESAIAYNAFKTGYRKAKEE